MPEMPPPQGNQGFQLVHLDVVVHRFLSVAADCLAARPQNSTQGFARFGSADHLDDCLQPRLFPLADVCCCLAAVAVDDRSWEVAQATP